ncbi:hypothetical protein Pfo_028628 [Paulownia fortunei]|nr:hypothetical protein Pfo_028628 [Paulownia fortunei]
MANRLEGKVALITGGASGIGEATAKLFARYGAKVIIADVQDERGHAICKEFASISYVHCDVTKESDVKNAVDGAVSEHGKLDIMFNNAGITVPMQYTSVLDSEKSHFEKVFDVNVYGAFLGAKHAARDDTGEEREHHIQFQRLRADRRRVPDFLCLELGKHGIRVNCVSPFLIPTPMLGSAMGGAVDEKTAGEWVAASANLKGAVAETDDIAEAAVFLGSDESKYVSGLNLVVDGGYSKVNPMITMAMRGVRL